MPAAVSPRVRRARRWPTVLTILVGVISAAVLGQRADATADRRRQDAFAVAVTQAVESIRRSIDRVESETLSLRSSLMFELPVRRDRFAARVAVDRRDGRYESFRAVSWVERVRPDELADFEASVRADRSVESVGYPDFEVTTAGDADDDLYVVNHLEPYRPNAAAHGFDLASEPSRQAAVVAAVDRAELVSTTPIVLVQADDQAQRAVLLLAAVYSGEEIPPTPPSRRRRVVGLVSTVAEVDAVFSRALGAEPLVEVSAFDVGATEGPVDESAPLDDANRLTAPPSGDPSHLTATADLDVGGRRWRVVMAPSTRFAPDVGSSPWATVGVAALITAALAVLVDDIAQARRRAELVASQRDRVAREVVAQFPAATLLTDAGGTVLAASDPMADLAGRPTAELVGSTVSTVVTRGERTGTGQVTRPDGSTVMVEVARHRAGPLDGTELVTVRDVAELEAERARMTLELEAKSAFVSTVSHELRTPLTAIEGFAAMLIDGGMGRDDSLISAEEAISIVRRIERNAASLRNLIEEVLDYSRLERGDMVLHPAPTDLTALVEGVAHQLGPVTRTHTVHLETHPGVIAEVDEAALGRVLVNLLTNAFRYSPEGTAVTVAVSGDDERARIVVDDEGPGIAPAERSRVFDRYYRGATARAAVRDGTGVGLSVVAELTEMMGGAVRLDESPAGGARFEISFPAVVGHAGSSGAPDA